MPSCAGAESLARCRGACDEDVASTPWTGSDAPWEAALAEQVQVGSGSVVQAITSLKAGQLVWVPQVAAEGPMLLIVNLSSQRALLFRNGVPIGATTVSTGKVGHDTPTGVFTVLQKQVEHHSSKYDNAPMPYMQRLTWGGVAVQARGRCFQRCSTSCLIQKLVRRLQYAQSALNRRTSKLGRPHSRVLSPLVRARDTLAIHRQMDGHLLDIEILLSFNALGWWS